MVAYYNENNKYAAQWLRNLITKNLIAPGDVDERSIADVQPEDIRGYSQCHFFAGIGGWSVALRLAGWDDNRPVWTGSCPCQPFSVAGKRKGKEDERHLWPLWFSLIRKCRPTVIFGEQVAGAIAKGWLDDTAHDLESESYAIGSAVLPACSVGAPHKRDRLWFVANHTSANAAGRDQNGWRELCAQEMGGADAHSIGGQFGDTITGRITCDTKMGKTFANSNKKGRADGQMEPRLRASEISLNRCNFVEAWQSWNGGFGGFGRLDDGVSSIMAKSVVGGLGNAIVPQVAAEFIKAYMNCVS